MKFLKKAIVLAVGVLLLAAVTPASLAVSNTSVEAGKTATLTFKFPDVSSLDGTFTISDPSGIVKSHTVSVTDTEAVSMSVSGDHVWALPNGDPMKTTVAVTVRVAIKSGVAAGKSCTVSFSGVYNDGNAEAGNEKAVTQSATVSVKAAPVVKPQVINYAGLEAEIAAAGKLNSGDYTAESWDKLAEALTNGKNALSSKSQEQVDTAEKTLANAVAGLVKIDYSKLRQALDNVDSYGETESLADQWLQLNDAVSVGKALLNSGDQAAVDAAAQRINEVLDLIDAQVDELRTPQTVEVEVPVEVPPEGNYCNITAHKVWPVLFFVSLAINVVLLLVTIFQRKKKETDDTPLVDYDISDDMS